MTAPKDPKSPSVSARADRLQLDVQADRKSRFAPWVAGIRTLSPRHRSRIERHLKALDEHDRYLRFGYMASDEQIHCYVEGLKFDQDVIFGVYNRRLEMIAMAHLAYALDKHCESCAEFGVSVLKSARGQGYGGKLFDRAVKHARNNGVQLMFIHALSENMAMLKIARKAGAKVEQDGSESRAYLRLPPATFDTLVTEMIEEKLAQTDYGLKRQARQFLDFLQGLQEVRRGVREGRHKSSP